MPESRQVWEILDRLGCISGQNFQHVKIFNKPPILSNNFIIYFDKNLWHLSQLSILSSYLGLQISEFMYARQFRSVTEATSIFQTKQYLLALSTQFLCLLDSNISDTQAQGLSIELLQQDLLYFHDFQRAETQFKAANKLFQKQDRNLEDELDDWKDDFFTCRW